MWELLESLFYYLKSKNIRLPLFLSLAAMVMVLVLSYETVEPPLDAPQPQVLRDEELLPPKEEVRTPSPPLITSDKKLPQKEDPPILSQKEDKPYGPFANHLEDASKKEGVDFELTQRILQKVREDFKRQGPRYDMRESIKEALGEDASDQDVRAMQDFVLRVAQYSFQEQEARGEVVVEVSD